MSALAVGVSTPSAATPLQTFHFDNLSIRTTLRNDEVWFVASDVCAALGLDNAARATMRLDDDEKGITSSNTLGGAQDTLIVSESGLYSLILTSRKPEAKRFKRWVTHEVLPAIRKTGGYRQPAPPLTPMEAARLLLADHLYGKRYLVRLYPDQPIGLTEIADTAFVVSPDAPGALEMIAANTPFAKLPDLLKAVMDRMLQAAAVAQRKTGGAR